MLELRKQCTATIDQIGPADRRIALTAIVTAAVDKEFPESASTSLPGWVAQPISIHQYVDAVARSTGSTSMHRSKATFPQPHRTDRGDSEIEFPADDHNKEGGCVRHINYG